MNKKYFKLLIISYILSIASITCYFCDVVLAEDAVTNDEGIKEDIYKWEIINENWHYTNQNGESKTGWIKWNEKWYYLNTEGIMQTGIININGIGYYLDKSGAMQVDWQYIDSKWYYFNSKGDMHKGWIKWHKKWYYLNTEGIMQTGWIDYNGDRYLLENSGAMLKQKWVKDGKKWYYLQLSGAKDVSSESVNPFHYYSYNYYYSQNDSRWRNRRYGYSTLGMTGCVPTVFSMALASIKNSSVWVPDVASWLYNKTSEFNKKFVGASAKGTYRMASEYGLKAMSLNSADEVTKALDRGMIVVVCVGKSKYAKPGITHALLLHGHTSGKTTVYDPLNKGNNGAQSISYLWSVRSTDSIDLYNGTPFVGLYR
ncbi:MAG: hypothetical protein PUI85_00230 [Eubacteriales bacterium]|nr:hypothetical protein [Eubacteriales bacterium]MDY3333027.1 hypothetical protein [Gallibacter sp.]